ncbi:MAG: S8 family serine peptidase [Clostridia bacterium]|nr:S8 family serine peptidase [Clostridia bacterium]
MNSCSSHSQSNKGNILVKFMDYKNSTGIKEHFKEKLSLKHLNTKKILKYSKTELLQLHEDDDFDEVVSHLHNHPEIYYAQPDYLLHACSSTDNQTFRFQWGLENTGQTNKLDIAGCCGIDIDVLDAWSITQGSESVVVAVLDTGIDINHIALKNSIYHNPYETGIDGKDNDGNNYCDDFSGWDFVNKDNTVYDSIRDAKHGTEVAGVIAARGVDAGTVGVAPGVIILPLKIMDIDKSCTSAAVEAIEYAKAKGIRLANCSWGDTNQNPALRFHMQNSDILFVCAAGNNGDDVSVAPFYPACFDLPNIISVAAVNNKGCLWPGSNYGNRIHVAAPGACILSTIPSEDECSYGIDTGTSLAAPHVTGIAALILSKYPDLDAPGIKQRIIQSVKPLSTLQDKVTSGGLVNAYKALV